MIVTCERCATQFQLDDARVKPKGVRVRCSRCKHAFFVEHPGRTDAEREAERVQRLAQAALDDTDPTFPDFPDVTEDMPTGSELDADDPAAGELETGDDASGMDWQFNQDPVPESSDAETGGTWGDDLAAADPDWTPELATDPDPGPGPIADPPPGDLDASSDFDLSTPDPLIGSDLGSDPVVMPAPEPDTDPLLGDLGPEEEDEKFEPHSEFDPLEDSIDAALSKPTVQQPPEPVASALPRAPEPSLVDADASGAPAWLTGVGHAVGWTAVCAVVAVGAWGGFRASLPASASTPAPVVLSAAGVDVTGLTARWIENASGAELYVLSGAVEPSASSARLSGAWVAVRLVDARGTALDAPPAVLGPTLSERSLREGPPAQLRRVLEREASRMAAAPLSRARRFHAVFDALPPEAAGFRLEAIPVAEAPPPASDPSAGPAPAPQPS